MPSPCLPLYQISYQSSSNFFLKPKCWTNHAVQIHLRPCFAYHFFESDPSQNGDHVYQQMIQTPPRRYSSAEFHNLIWGLLILSSLFFSLKCVGRVASRRRYWWSCLLISGLSSELSWYTYHQFDQKQIIRSEITVHSSLRNLKSSLFQTVAVRARTGTVFCYDSWTNSLKPKEGSQGSPRRCLALFCLSCLSF